MLTGAQRRGGFTLIELLVTITLVALLMMLAVPAMGSWVADARVRSTAESLQSALHLAQSTAVTRSRSSVLALTSAAPAWNAVPAGNGSNWFVRLLPLPDSDDAAGTDSFIQGATAASQYGVKLVGPALLCFNSLGQLSTKSASATGMSAACSAGATAEYTLSRSGGSRQLKVRVEPGGKVRMCDVAKSLSNGDPDGCPKT